MTTTHASISSLILLPGDDAQNRITARRLGGKAANLLTLQQLGQPVPDFYVITADALPQMTGQVVSQRDDDDEARAAEMHQRILNTELPSDLVAAIEQAHAACFCDETPVAVRSSAIGEDGESHSFAGIYDSVLGVRTLNELLAAVQQVWASAYAPRALAYRRQRGLPLLDTGMAVIVQRMIEARQSGVCFGCNPATGAADEMIVSSLWGLGEGLVSRGFAADSYYVDRHTLAVKSESAEKREKLVLGGEQPAPQCVDVPEDEMRQSSLSDEQVRQVARAALAIEEHFGVPQDVEFCYSQEGELFILQTRPVTAFGGIESRESRVKSQTPAASPHIQLSTLNSQPSTLNHTIWDNSNIIESYSGVTTPMTFSFIRRAYSIVYHCFSEVMGIPPRVVYEQRDAFDNMLGLFRGRVYYNLKNWYRLVRLFPGYRYNSRFMESMMGVKESLFLEEEEAQPGFWRRWFVEFPSLLKLLGRSGWNFFRIRSRVDNFQRHFRRHYDEWSQIDFDSLPPHELMALYHKMEEALLWNWKAPIINDFYVMVFYGVLKKLCTTWGGDETGTLQNGLIAGEGGLESDGPAKLLLQMAAVARNDDALRQLIDEIRLEDLPSRVAGDERFEEFNRLMSRYLDEYGLRCANELKLESFSYRDQPERLYQIIRNYLGADDASAFNLESIAGREREVRRKAERQCREALVRARSWWPRRWLFNRVLRNARQGVRNRENMRFARTRIYGILRSMLRSIGRQLAEAGVLDDREDIFYLTIDEVWDFIKGTAVSADLRGLAQLRRAEYDAYRSETVPPPDNRFETFGMAYHGNSFRNPSAVDASEIDKQNGETVNENLTGIGCCPGIVSGRVQVVRDPSSAMRFDGDILVAERTDPGWVPIYPAFRGILIERGSVLSHSAIVAREMGIPTIVGVAGLTARLRSGQNVRMDGRTGTVQIIDEP